MRQFLKTLSAYRATARMCFKQVFDGNLLCVAGEYWVRFLSFFLLTLLWRSLAASGGDLGGMTLSQLLTYSLMATVWRQQLDIITPATSALWEGAIVGRYQRPMSVTGSFMAETVGRWWLPVLLFYGLPLWLFSPLLGINPLPADPLWGLAALMSLGLSASLGFALDLAFAALAVRMKDGCWAALQVREAVFALLSGAFLPFALLPEGVGKVFSLLPFGSIASAPLSLYVGLGDPGRLLLLQAGWNLLLWPAALWAFHRSEERMVSYGG